MTFSVLKSLLPAAFLSLAALGAQACQHRDAAVAAVETADFLTAAALFAEVDVDPACDDDFREWLAEALARDKFAQAMANPDPNSQRALYEQSLAYSRHWRTYDALAQLAGHTGDQAGQAQYLQQAINQLNDGPERHTATQAEIAGLLQRASAAMLMAEATVDIPTTRSGAPGGVFSTEVRGFVVEEVSLPITFEYDSTRMTPKGAFYARKLLDHLKQTRPPLVTLEGHTDPKGDSAYNDRLSLARANAVRSYLEQNGYFGPVQLRGMGERALPPATADAPYGSSMHHRLARRVVLVRG